MKHCDWLKPALGVLLFGLGAARPGVVRADQLPPETAARPAERPADEHGAKHADKGDKGHSKKKKSPLAIHGRVVVREQLESEADGPWTSKLGLEDVRLGAKYAYGKRVTIAIELGAKDTVELKDAFVELKLAKAWHLRAGRFRMPISGHSLTSRWKLPTVDRGLASDMLDGGLGVVGRRSGAQLEWEPDCGCNPRIVLAAFQGTTGGGSNKGLLSDDQGAVDVVLRGEVDVASGVRVGAAGSNRVELKNAVDGRERYWAGNVDITAAHPLGGGHLRAWAEALIGTTHLDATPATTATPTFLSTRAVLAWRHGGDEDGDQFIEPFVSGSVGDPNLKNADDLLIEVAGGLNVGLWDQWRAQLQGELVRVDALVPAAIAGGISAPTDHVAVTLQLGAAF